MPVLIWEEATTVEIGGLGADAVAVLPVAAVEQHGPHLPLGTDAYIADAILDAALTRVADDVAVWRLPTQRIGTSREHASFPGTLCLAPETALRAWTELGRSLAAAGLRRLVLFNTHGGQPQIVDLVALTLRRESGMLAVRANLFAFALPDGLIGADERRFGFHGGEIETALMLHLAPHLVRRENLRAFESSAAAIAAGSAVLEAEGEAGFAWLAEDLNPNGTTGDAARATPETGARLLAHYADRLGHVIEDAARFPLDRLR